ncbi:Aldo/keto reductase family-domain-containing protein [Neurospora tetraspora]|uniref:Aldo/keto reductase family-domain-containing protein n=1 Tax=Neurospora tetraspora TaxID=94610 RepID=A0AAE0MQR0_9PEZI|nr:Aldo/keto reductase family-domain-containing protein [Neurospora tetraspora]
MAPSTTPPLKSTLPPLLLGTATFNTQYVPDPHSLPYRSIVARAISLGVRGFDTSPYYGPSEILVGDALNALFTSETNPLPREDVFIVTKAGRIASDEFDYSPAWVRYSIYRSLQRLHTEYLDLVYMHDVEFVSPAEVLGAVKELRRLRDEEGVIKYVGISGFPPKVLAELAEMILRETGEPLDAMMSYGHFTVQNRLLGVDELLERKEEESSVLKRFKKAGVEVILNASMLGMGLLTQKGIPPNPESKESPLVKWHPSPPELRIACKKLGELAAAKGERLESVAIRWALEEWARVGAEAGVGVDAGSGSSLKVGATVCGVSSIPELEETVAEWNGVLEGLEKLAAAGGKQEGRVYGSERQEKVLKLVEDEMWPALGNWIDFTWASPGEGYVNTRRPEDKGKVPDDGVIAAHEERVKNRKSKL